MPGGHTADMASSGDTRLNIKIRKYEKRDHDTVCRIFYNGLMENWVRVKVSTNFCGTQYWRRCLQQPINDENKEIGGAISEYCENYREIR